MGYENLLIVAEHHGIYVYETSFRSDAMGLTKGNVIGINKNLLTTEKTCALAEEIIHIKTTVGDIIDQSDIRNRKMERFARTRTFQWLIPFGAFVRAHKAGISGRHDLAEYFGVTEEFLQDAIDRFFEKYGKYMKYDDQYTICFDPLEVIEHLE